MPIFCGGSSKASIFKSIKLDSAKESIGKEKLNKRKIAIKMVNKLKFFMTVKFK